MKASRTFVRLKLTAENSQDLSLLDQIIGRLQEGKALSEYNVDGQDRITPPAKETTKEKGAKK